MTISEQLSKLKENWLLIVLVLVVILIFSGGGSNYVSDLASNTLGGVYMERAVAPSAAGDYETAKSSMMPIYDEGFAPEVTQRKITKNSYMSSEVERGMFPDAEARLKAIIVSSEALLLSENSDRYGEGGKGHFVGSYNIKVDTKKYDAVITQLKEIGEVQSFSQNAADITGQYTDLNTELATEKSRLERYKAMYAEAKEINDKITLNDRIFDEERTIKYLEDALKNIDQRVDYSTVSVTLTEKQSDYANIVFVKFSELVVTIAGSLNTLLNFLFWIAPWAVLYLILRAIYNRFFTAKRRY